MVFAGLLTRRLPLAASVQLGAFVSGSQPPSRIGSYQIVRELGRGGMGVVYVARHETLSHLLTGQAPVTGSPSLVRAWRQVPGPRPPGRTRENDRSALDALWEL